MRNRRLIRRLFYPLLLLAVTSGCQAFHASRPIAIEAMDAETKKPIPGVEVRISYPLETSSFAPGESKGTTGSDGIARLNAAPYGRAGVMVEVSAKGYMSEVKYLSIQEVEALEPAHWFEDVRQRPASVVMEMFADPAPTVELIAPSGFRGQIKAKVQVQADLPFEAGQRSFSYAVPTAGEVTARGPSLFRHVSSANVRVKFADGRPLSLRGKESELGYWFVKNEASCYYFFVGTPRDFDSYCRKLQSGEGSSQGSGPSDVKGRHGRKSTGDANP